MVPLLARFGCPSTVGPVAAGPSAVGSSALEARARLRCGGGGGIDEGIADDAPAPPSALALPLVLISHVDGGRHFEDVYAGAQAALEAAGFSAL